MAEKDRETILKKAVKIASILEAKKAHDVKILYVHDRTIIADYFVIAHGTSSTQVKALCDEVEFRMNEGGVPCTSIQGRDGTNWIVMDYDDVLVHVFHRDARNYYNLEKLWADAEQVEFTPEPIEGINAEKK
ncbi:MAG: ribosome silencing factor [Clostridia bacterium]|nr:ribosome silencing factor [Clostridia bacterium]